MRRVDIFQRSVHDAMNIVRYLEKRNLISQKQASTLKRNILDSNTDFVSSDKDMSYWNECKTAHELEEITNEELFSVVNVRVKC